MAAVTLPAGKKGDRIRCTNILSNAKYITKPKLIVHGMVVIKTQKRIVLHLEVNSRMFSGSITHLEVYQQNV